MTVKVLRAMLPNWIRTATKVSASAMRRQRMFPTFRMPDIAGIVPAHALAFNASGLVLERDDVT